MFFKAGRPPHIIRHTPEVFAVLPEVAFHHTLKEGTEVETFIVGTQVDTELEARRVISQQFIVAVIVDRIGLGC